jgi:hypothetical protein
VETLTDWLSSPTSIAIVVVALLVVAIIAIASRGWETTVMK